MTDRRSAQDSNKFQLIIHLSDQGARSFSFEGRGDGLNIRSIGPKGAHKFNDNSAPGGGRSIIIIIIGTRCINFLTNWKVQEGKCSQKISLYIFQLII